MRMRRRCKKCGQMFSPYGANIVNCDACRKPKNRGKRPVVPQEERLAQCWTRWLETQLEPFLGQESVRVNDLILYLRERKERAA